MTQSRVPHLAADLDGRCAIVDLTKRVGDFLLRVEGPFHGVSSLTQPEADTQHF
jgi:hypothetical protein